MRFNLLPPLLLVVVLARPILAEAEPALPDAKALTLSGDLSAQMVAGIDKFLDRALDQSVDKRVALWQRDFSSPAAYEKSIAPNREHLRKLIGAVDARLPVTALEYVRDTGTPAMVAETARFTVHAVRWPVFPGVYGEGLWLQPKGITRARIVALPDAGQTPEAIAGLAGSLPSAQQFARRLAEQGCEVLVPTLIDRDDTWSGNAGIKRFTNQPHREWIYRQSFQLGRHPIGYEVQKVLAAVDWFEFEAGATHKTGIGVAGYGEGALIAFYAAALGPRIHAALVSGYFEPRQNLWREPIYRNVFGLLREFGDAEVASLITPRALIVEHSEAPKVEGPPPIRAGRSGAAPGRIISPEFAAVQAEFARAEKLMAEKQGPGWAPPKLIAGENSSFTGPGSDTALLALLQALGVTADKLVSDTGAIADRRKSFDATERQHRQVVQLEEFTQSLLRGSERMRADYFWRELKPRAAADWSQVVDSFRRTFWEEHLGRLPAPSLPVNLHRRQILTEPKWTGYEVMLDVHPDIFAWGYLLVPTDLKPGERRPVVVCQHGLEGVPDDVVTRDPTKQGFGYYKAFAARLAEQGFVVFAPHNPYRGGDRFRVLQRKANPLGLTLFSVIVAQHQQILNWLSGLPFVDAKRIGFYGLSYGGKSAMRIPAVLDGYALSICSADFNEWTRKNASVDFPGSYVFVGEYEISEWNLGPTFDYAEMAALIAPRPFMVERGHSDPVGLDEWVAHEYAKVRRLYDQLKIPERTRIEFFDGPHTINGVGTFEFLHQQLQWPPH